MTTRTPIAMNRPHCSQALSFGRLAPYDFGEQVDAEAIDRPVELFELRDATNRVTAVFGASSRSAQRDKTSRDQIDSGCHLLVLHPRGHTNKCTTRV